LVVEEDRDRPGSIPANDVVFDRVSHHDALAR